MESHAIVTERASVLRQLGRRGLSGNWRSAVLISFLFILLTVGPQMVMDYWLGGDAEPEAGTAVVETTEELVAYMQELTNSDSFRHQFNLDFLCNLYILLVYGPFYYGLATFIRGMCRHKEHRVSQLFDGFEHFLKSFSLNIMISLLIFLWSLLFVIPGIIAAYRYSMAYYLILDNPEMGVFDAITRSKEMMRGNKWKLFCLDLSFIGWALLSVLTCGIGTLWLLPYMETTQFQFYEILNGNLVVRRAEYVEAENCSAQNGWDMDGSRSDCGCDASGSWKSEEESTAAAGEPAEKPEGSEENR